MKLVAHVMGPILLAGLVAVACSSGESAPEKPGSGGSDASMPDAKATGGSGGKAGAETGTGGDSSLDAPVAEADVVWKLVWSDEFDGSGLADSTKWDYEEGFVRNNEAQWYTKARVENARQENGHLLIEARKEDFSGASYTSASLITKGKFDFTYGRLEVSAKIPTGKGSWPAIWLLGTNIDQVGWPECGEIDVMENVGFTPNTIYCTIHAQGSSSEFSEGKQTDLNSPTPFDAFHLYAMEWSATSIVLSVDDAPVEIYENDGQNPWPFDKPEYLLLNLAIGGSWGGQQGIDDSLFPLQYEIDYVRFYQRQ